MFLAPAGNRNLLARSVGVLGKNASAAAARLSVARHNAVAMRSPAAAATSTTACCCAAHVGSKWACGSA